MRSAGEVVQIITKCQVTEEVCRYTREDNEFVKTPGDKTKRLDKHKIGEKGG